MGNRQNLPAKGVSREVSVPSMQRKSLVVRGLQAIRQSQRLALAEDNDLLYRKARDAYNLVTDDGDKNGWGDIWTGDELVELKEVFAATVSGLNF
jgi:hypothetical protein